MKYEWLFALSVSHGNIILFSIVLYRLYQIIYIYIYKYTASVPTTLSPYYGGTPWWIDCFNIYTVCFNHAKQNFDKKLDNFTNYEKSIPFNSSNINSIHENIGGNELILVIRKPS